MPTPKIALELNKGVYFLTFTIKSWYYVFDRHNRWEILVDSLNYCTKNKGLKVYSYVLMLNHVHLIIESDDVSGFVRDFKKYTSKELKKNMERTEPRVLSLFLEQDQKYNFWKTDNMPIIIDNDKLFLQKKKYIENNPVVKSYIDDPTHWRYSSANYNSPVKIFSDTNV